jgi:hypothetical protein
MDERVYRMTEEILLELDKMKPEEINSLREEWLGELENRRDELQCFVSVKNYVNVVCDTAIDRVNRRIAVE